MVLHNATVDPYRPSEGYYECRDCGLRVAADSVQRCDDCGSARVYNISVPRE
jgi:DNA-directed RNA polymerase subunit RPC12/RpoP